MVKKKGFNFKKKRFFYSRKGVASLEVVVVPIGKVDLSSKAQ